VYLNLLAEIDNDELICALELLISRFKHAVAPFAVTLLQRFVTSFFRIISSDDEDFGSIASAECLQGILLVLRTIKDTPLIYEQIDTLLLFPLSRCLGEEFMEYFEQFLQIMSLFACYAPTVSENLWNLFPLVIQSAVQWAIDYLPRKETLSVYFY
jgi:importin-7